MLLALTLRRNDVAVSEGIASVAGPARALRQVVHHLAVRVLAAGPRTRVHALVANASPVGRAVRVDHTLGPAALVRVADVLGQTGARSRAVLLAADGVRSTRRGFAGRGPLLDRRGCKREPT